MLTHLGVGIFSGAIGHRWESDILVKHVFCLPWGRVKMNSTTDETPTIWRQVRLQYSILHDNQQYWRFVPPAIHQQAPAGCTLWPLSCKGLDVFYEQGAMDDILSPLREKLPKAGTPPQAGHGWRSWYPTYHLHRTTMYLQCILMW